MRMLIPMLLAACGGSSEPTKTRDDLVKAYGPKLQPRMAVLVEAGKTADAATVLDQAGSFEDLDVDYTDNRGNGVVVQLEDLQDLATDATPELRMIEQDRDSVRIAKTFAGPRSSGSPRATGRSSSR